MFIQSPIPYTGSKWRIFRNVWKTAGYLEYNHIVDVFCGSLTAAINLAEKGQKIIANDIQTPLIMLYEAIANNTVDEEAFIAEKNELIKKYSKRELFNLVKKEYNSNPQEHLLDIFLLAHYCYGGLVEFNGMTFKAHFGNKGFSNKGFSKSYLDIFEKFCNKLKSRRFQFTNLDFREIDYSQYGEQDLLYFDPPYFVTNSFYNASWRRQEELALYAILDELSSRSVNWILSNAISKGNKTNYVLEDWIRRRSHGISYPNIEYSMSNDEIKEIMVFSNPNLFPNT